MKRVLLAWWFTWYMVDASGVTTLGRFPETYPHVPPTQAECEAVREKKIEDLVTLLRTGIITTFEVHACESLNRTPQ